MSGFRQADTHPQEREHNPAAHANSSQQRVSPAGEATAADAPGARVSTVCGGTDRRVVVDELEQLIGILPLGLQPAARQLPQESLLELILDYGRVPQARLVDALVELGTVPATREDLQHVVAAVGEFGGDNRAGIEGTLHRIAAIRNRRGDVVGLTLRVGRSVEGTIASIQDLVENGQSILLLGRPGVGKTTKLRGVAPLLADDFGKRVIVIDTSNEIAGDGDLPHPAIGSARRMQVAHPERQHAVMIEAVENHMPEVIIIDEIGTEAEALAARTVAERGVQLIATAHGNTLANLVLNPTLADLVGGIQTVTLGDDEARLRGTQKTIRERKAPPTFDAVVEIVDRERVAVHADTAHAVDTLLREGVREGTPRGGEAAEADSGLRVANAAHAAGAAQAGSTSPRRVEPVRINTYAVSRDVVERAIRRMQLDARTVKHPENADLVLALKTRAEDKRLQLMTRPGQIPIHVVRKNTAAQIRRVLHSLFAALEQAEQQGDDTSALIAPRAD